MKLDTQLLSTLAVVGFFVGCSVSSVDTPSSVDPSSAARDPGVRGGAAGAGAPIAGLTKTELAFFNAGKDDFAEEEEVADGLGPTMNLGSCGGCHLQPALGGTSPPVNPQIAFASKNGAANTVPSFITLNGPVREARFVRNPDGTPDGGVHDLFTIAGRADAPGCMLAQPDFEKELAHRNVIFRIPTPVFGAGLIEQIPDKVILANQANDAPMKRSLRIRGRPNIVLAGHTISGQANNNGNDGTVARFGWKAQNKSLLLFSGEAYNVEMGITNELFQTERDETPTCQFATVPNDVTKTDGKTPARCDQCDRKVRLLHALPGAADAFARYAGRGRFHCEEAETCSAVPGARSVIRPRSIRAMPPSPRCATKPVNLFSDLLVHDMGPGLADGVTQGQAGPREFRTAPLWGLGQRLFFLHDGRTSDLLEAIRAHQSGRVFTGDASEANAVIKNFNPLRENQKQDVLNFLRSL